MNADDLKFSNTAYPAVVLYKEIVLDDRHRTDVKFFRVKILTDDGKRAANVEISFFPGLEEIENIWARTYAPDGNVTEWQGPALETTVLRKKKFQVLVKKVVLPNVGVGSVIEYGYRIHWKRIAYWRDWEVQGDLFTREAYFSFTAAPLPYASINWTRIGFKGDVDTNHTKDKWEFILTVTNIPPFEEEEYMPAEEDVRPRVRFAYVSATQFRTDFWYQFSRDQEEYFKKYIGHSREIEAEATRVTSKVSPKPEEKLRALYARAQQIQHTDTVGREQRKREFAENKNAEDVLRHGYGTSREINALFVALARAAGFSANVVLLMPRTNGRWAKAIDVSGLSEQIAWIDKQGFLDPGTPFCPFGLLPWYDNAAGGIKVDDQFSTSISVDTPVPQRDDALLVRRADLTLDDTGRSRGKITLEFSGQEALARRDLFYDSDEAARRKSLEEEIKESLPTGASVELKQVLNLEDATKPMIAEFSVDIPELASSTGKRLLLPIAILRVRNKRAFTSTHRAHPVEFSYPYKVADEIRLRLPEGYAMENLPPKSPWNLDWAGYEVSGELNGQELALHRRFEMRDHFFAADKYAGLRSFFEKVASNDDQQVVLRPVTQSAEGK